MIDSSNFRCHNFFFRHAKIPIKYFSLLPYNFSNLVAIILFFFFLPFSATWLAQFFFLFLFSSHFWQLGCYNSYFLSPHSPTISATWLPQFIFSLSTTPPSSTSPGQEFWVAKILVISLSKFKFFSHSSHHIIYLSSLILFDRISATLLLKIAIFPHFPK